MLHAYYSDYQRELSGCVHLGARPDGQLIEYTELSPYGPESKAGPYDFVYLGMIRSHVETIVLDQEVYRLYSMYETATIIDSPESKFESICRVFRMETVGLLVQCGVRPARAMKDGMGTPDGYRLGFRAMFGIN